MHRLRRILFDSVSNSDEVYQFSSLEKMLEIDWIKRLNHRSNFAGYYIILHEISDNNSVYYLAASILVGGQTQIIQLGRFMHDPSSLNLPIRVCKNKKSHLNWSEEGF